MAGLSGGPGDSGDLIGLRDRTGPSLIHERPSSRRAILVAAVSTVAFFTILVLIVVNAPGWPEVQAKFFNGRVFADSWPLIVRAFWINVQLFILAELLVLPFGLLIAVLRSLPGPVFLPVRILATAYVDIFRALPGRPRHLHSRLRHPRARAGGRPGTSRSSTAVVALTLIYSAYVSEVYRAGIDSVHPSQEAAARSLGLTRLQALRHVILPQAVRRVIPPLLNDFIGLQKDTVLVSFIGVVEIFRQSQIRQAGSFNFTPYIATALVFLVLTIPLARLTDGSSPAIAQRSAASAR